MFFKLNLFILGFVVFPKELFSQKEFEYEFRKAISSYLTIPGEKINTLKSGVVIVEFYSVNKKDTASILKYSDKDYLVIVENAIRQYFKVPIKGHHFKSKQIQPFVFLITNDEGLPADENMVKIDTRDIYSLTNFIPYKANNLNKPIIQTAIKSKIRD